MFRITWDPLPDDSWLCHVDRIMRRVTSKVKTVRGVKVSGAEAGTLLKLF